MSDQEIIEDKSSSGLQEVPESVLHLTNLKMLYLDRNHIRRLPEDFFQKLPFLYWLDLRNNKLETIPTGIAHHQCLENLLIQKNRLKSLPNELGLVPNLKILQLADNPLEYPPAVVVEGGVDDIVHFLKEEFMRLAESNDEMKNSESVAEEARSLNSKSSSNFSLPKTDNRTGSGTLQLEILPMVLRKTISKHVEDRRKAYLENKCSKQKMHQLLKSPSRLCVHSQYKYSPIKDVLPSESKMNADQIRNIWVDKLRELITDQERILQQEKSMKALEKWRQQKKEENLKSSSNKSDISFESLPPFDTNPAYNAYMSRTDLTKQIEQILRLEQPAAASIDMETMINDVVDQLKRLQENSENVNHSSPAEKLKSAETELKMITDINKKLTEFRTKSFL